jgi:hypothetical protein
MVCSTLNDGEAIAPINEASRQHVLSLGEDLNNDRLHLIAVA